MDKIYISSQIREGWEKDAIKEGITDQIVFLSYLKMREKEYISALGENLVRKQIYDNEGNLTEEGIKFCGQSLFNMQRNKRAAKLISIEFENLTDYLAKKGKFKKGKELFNLDNFLQMRKDWYNRLLIRLKSGVLGKEDIPFNEYRKFAYMKV